MLFATLILDHEPLTWAELPRAIMIWVQNAGGLAALGALFWLAATYGQSRLNKRPMAVNKLAIVILALSWIGFLAMAVLFAVNSFSNESLYWLLPTDLPRHSPADLHPPPLPPLTIGDYLSTSAGACALAVVLAPVLLSIGTRLRWGRIWAMARLSLKEAVRSRVVLIFGAMALIFLFADWFVPYKPENQVRNYVRVLYWSMTPLFLMTASLLGSFGIPTDVKSQAIHTIVTKPVEKFEIVLGRFLGYAVLITVGLAAVTGVSMLYMFRGVTEEAGLESFKAREPVYGNLSYYGTKERGDNVGRAFDVRGYITGPDPRQPNQPRQYGIWTFDSLPSSVGASGAPVRVEFGFDIFRLTKGIENQGVLCTFLFADGRLTIAELEKKKNDLQNDSTKRQDAARKKFGGNAAELQKALAQIQVDLLKEYGIYQYPSFNVTDYHTQDIEVPAALFERLRELESSNPRKASGPMPPPPMFQVTVSVDYDQRGQNQQMLGIARRDFYLLAAENNFFVNFAKGIVGLWSLLMLVLGMAVACSAYLSGVISWLCTIFLIVAGLFVTDIQQLAENRDADGRPLSGGGPLEAAVRLINRLPVAGQLDDTPSTTVITGVDEMYRWWLRRFLNFVPDVTRYDLHPYVANGFDISWGQVLLLDNIIPLLGYLIPWAVLAFYLMKYREIANPM